MFSTFLKVYYKIIYKVIYILTIIYKLGLNINNFHQHMSRRTGSNKYGEDILLLSVSDWYILQTFYSLWDQGDKCQLHDPYRSLKIINREWIVDFIINAFLHNLIKQVAYIGYLQRLISAKLLQLQRFLQILIHVKPIVDAQTENMLNLSMYSLEWSRIFEFEKSIE